MIDVTKLVKQNVKDMPASGIRKYFDILNEVKDVISLGVGEPDFVTPWRIREAGIYSLEKGKTAYSANAGAIELRESIAGYLKRRFNLEYSAKDEILVTVGGSEAIDLAVRTFAGPGDEVIVPEPSFVAYKGCVTFANATPVTLDLEASNNFKLTVEQLEKVITPRTKMLILAYPNNPTGAIMTREDLKPIVDYLKDKEIVILSDEIYAELTYTEERHCSIAEFPEIADRVILVSGFSKAFAMTGWRLGYVCAQRDILSQMFKIHQYAIMCSPTVSQQAGIEAMEYGAEEVEMMKKEYNRRRRVMLQGFRDAGLDCYEPLGAFYLFPDIRKTGLSSEDFCERLLVEQKVLMVHGNAFGECGKGFARATYATSMENIVEACKRIKYFVESLK